jgi:hypothetical protein
LRGDISKGIERLRFLELIRYGNSAQDFQQAFGLVILRPQRGSLWQGWQPVCTFFSSHGLEGVSQNRDRAQFCTQSVLFCTQSVCLAQKDCRL